MILVSSCLLGEKCKYNGEDNFNKDLVALLKNQNFIKVCPECLGKMSTPRLPAEIQGGNGFDVWQNKARIINKKGQDVTLFYLAGASLTALIARKVQAKIAILKANSPSCGISKIYDGNFNGCLAEGPGCASARLKQAGLALYSENDLEQLSRLSKL